MLINVIQNPTKKKKKPGTQRTIMSHQGVSLYENSLLSSKKHEIEDELVHLGCVPKIFGIKKIVSKCKKNYLQIFENKYSNTWFEGFL